MTSDRFESASATTSLPRPSRLVPVLVVAALLCVPTTVWSQDATVVGAVAIDGGLPLPAAHIRIKGTLYGSTSNKDGTYRIEHVPPGSYDLVCSSVGFGSLTKPVVLVAGETVQVKFDLAETTIAAGEVVVTATQTATRSDAPRLLIPQSVSIVSDELLSARQVSSIGEALRTTTGVSTFQQHSPHPDFLLRGFPLEATGSVRRNGVEIVYNADPLRANVSSVEVLKGPSSVLYGRIEPGGVINVVTKRPLVVTRSEFTAEVGNGGHSRIVADVTGPALPSIRYRFIGAAESRATRRTDSYDRHFLLAPAVAWQLSNRVSLTIEAEAEHVEALIDPGVVAPIADVDAADRAVFYGDPDGRYKWQSGLGAANVDADLGGGWMLQSTLSASSSSRSRGLITLVTVTEADSVGRRYQDDDTRYRYLQGSAVVRGRHGTGPISHRIVGGIDVTRLAIDVEAASPLRQLGDGTFEFARIDPVGLIEPRSGGLPRRDDLVTFASAIGKGVNAGVFVQDRLTNSREKLHLLVSARLARVTAGAELFALADTPDAPAGITKRDLTIWALTPGLGLVYEPLTGLAFYGSYGRSFNPIFQQVDAQGEPFEPTRGVGFEAGAKADLAGVEASLTVFELTKRGALTQSPDDFYVQTGEQRSRGLEVEIDAKLVVSPASALQISGAYSYMAAVVTADDVIPVGNRLALTPRHQGAIWVSYGRDSGALAGLGVHAGVFATGARYATLENEHSLPRHAEIEIGSDLAVSRRARLSLVVRNVLDRRYAAGGGTIEYSGSDGPWLRVWPGLQRTAQLRLAVRL